MLHYGMQHAAVHDAGGGDESLSHVDAPTEADYAHWLQLSSPSEVMSPVQVQGQASHQAFVQDAYSAPQSAYYDQPPQTPVTPVAVEHAFNAQDQYGYYLYSPLEQQPPQEQAQYAYYDEAKEPEEQEQQQHILATPPSSAYPQQDTYSLYTSYATPEQQQHVQMSMYSSSPIERQARTVTSQPPVLSTSRPRGYPSSTNPVRPSRLRQVSNYEEDVPDGSDLPDHATSQATTFDERLAASVLVPQPSESLAFALASPIKMDTTSSSSSLSHALQQLSTSPVHHVHTDSGPSETEHPDAVSLLPSQSHSQSELYEALFASADVAPIVTTREEVQVELDPAWAADSELVGSSAVDVAAGSDPVPEFSALASALSDESALAGAVMDEFEVRQLAEEMEPTEDVGMDAFDMDVDADADADADGETEAESPMPPMPDMSNSNGSSASNAHTASTLVDDDWFLSPGVTQLKLGEPTALDPDFKEEEGQPEPGLELALEDILASVEEKNPPPTSDSTLTASEQVAALSAALSSLAESAPSDALSASPPALVVPAVVEPTKEEADPAAALLALAAPTPLPTPVHTVPIVPLITLATPKRATGGKRKRGSATSSPARSRLSSPMPLAAPLVPRRRFFAPSPIRFHIGPMDDADPRQRMRHGTRTNKLVGIDAEHQLDDKEKDHDLFIIRGGVFDHIPNGARIKVAAAQRSSSKSKGAENGGATRSATASRAGSVAGSSPAPGPSKQNRAKKAKISASTRETSEVVFTPSPAPSTSAPAERPKREVVKRGQNAPQPAKSLFTNVPRQLPFAAQAPPLPYSPFQPAGGSAASYFSDSAAAPAFPARSHAALSSALPEPLIPFVPEPVVSRRAPPLRRPPAVKASKAAAKKRKRELDEEYSLEELENINHDGGYDEDYAASSSVRAAPAVAAPPLKRPRRTVAPPAAFPLAVPPRSSAALPPIAVSIPPLPATPSTDSLSFPSPLTPLTDLPSSSPPGPSPSPAAPLMLPPRTFSRPQTPAPALPMALSPMSALTPSPQVQAPLPMPAKRGPRRAPAMPAFSHSGPRALPLESPVASSSSVTLDGMAQHPVTRTGDEANFAAVQPVRGALQPAYRTYPAGMETRTGEFSLWYRRYPIVAVFRPWDPLGDAVLGTQERPKAPNGATFNNPTTVYDLYTPRFVKGTGREKQGMCPVCAEAPERGGEGKQQWFAMKVSAYNYHMQNAHGISASSKLPFSPPIEFRCVKRPASGRHEKDAVLEGKCHQCQKFVPLEGVKLGDIKVKEIYWWKHAAKCHQSGVTGECDLYYEDEVLARVKSHEERERISLSRSSARNAPPATYPLPTAFLVMPTNAAGTYVPQSPVMQMPGHGVPMHVHPGPMSYGQAAAASISQFQVPVQVAGSSHHGSPIEPMNLSPTQASFLRTHAPPHSPIAYPQLSHMGAAATYGTSSSTMHNTASAADAAAAYIAATSGLPPLAPPEMHMQ